MTQPIGPGQIMFRIHGPSPTDDAVSALVFGQKLATLVRALTAADKALNGSIAYDYKIAKLRSSAPTVVIDERPRPRYGRLIPLQSGIRGLEECANAIAIGARDKALRYGRCAAQLNTLARGAPKQFSYAELWTDRETIIRVDSLMGESATEVVSEPVESEALPGDSWFKGIAHGSFVGEIKVVDLRGARPEIALVLSAGGKQIDCVCREEDVQKIGSLLQKRVRIYGRAIYDGRNGLPRRVEVTNIASMPTPGDFARWKGAFEPFEAPEWDGDDL